MSGGVSKPSIPKSQPAPLRNNLLERTSGQKNQGRSCHPAIVGSSRTNYSDRSTTSSHRGRLYSYTPSTSYSSFNLSHQSIIPDHQNSDHSVQSRGVDFNNKKFYDRSRQRDFSGSSYDDQYSNTSRSSSGPHGAYEDAYDHQHGDEEEDDRRRRRGLRTQDLNRDYRARLFQEHSDGRSQNDANYSGSNYSSSSSGSRGSSRSSSVTSVSSSSSVMSRKQEMVDDMLKYGFSVSNRFEDAKKHSNHVYQPGTIIITGDYHEDALSRPNEGINILDENRTATLHGTIYHKFRMFVVTKRHAYTFQCLPITSRSGRCTDELAFHVGDEYARIGHAYDDEYYGENVTGEDSLANYYTATTDDRRMLRCRRDPSYPTGMFPSVKKGSLVHLVAVTSKDYKINSAIAGRLTSDSWDRLAEMIGMSSSSTSTHGSSSYLKRVRSSCSCTSLSSFESSCSMPRSDSSDTYPAVDVVLVYSDHGSSNSNSNRDGERRIARCRSRSRSPRPPPAKRPNLGSSTTSGSTAASDLEDGEISE